MITSSIQEDVIAAVARDLHSIGSTMVIKGKLDESFERTIIDVLSQTAERMSRDENSSPSSPIAVRYAVTRDFAEIASSVADAERHPAEPLMAGEVVFDVALPMLALANPTWPPIRLAKTLHNEIWRRFPPGAIAYVEIILSRLARANREERAVIARELHDRVADHVANGLQRIELAYEAPDASMHLSLAQSELRAALVDIQDLAIALRPIVQGKSLGVAIDELIDRLPERPRITHLVHGSPKPLLESINEEVFSIVVEAVRNARRHSRGGNVQIETRWDTAHLYLTVRDDGGGFEVHKPQPSGLRSMQERSQIIGAHLTIESGSLGTSVRLELPLGRATLSERHS